jgi:hypothetical protein
MYTGQRVHRNGRRCRAAITRADRSVIADMQNAAVKKAIRKVENASGGWSGEEWNAKKTEKLCDFVGIFRSSGSSPIDEGCIGSVGRAKQSIPSENRKPNR